MLLWEALTVPSGDAASKPSAKKTVNVRTLRLPFDKRCAAVTKAGHRCRGRIRDESDFCFFHNPELTAERRRRMAVKSAESRRRRANLPDGYLRKLTSRTAVGNAMDRLYREVRLGLVSREMGVILFNILTRLLDSELVKSGPCPDRSKAAKLRPKLRDLLTAEECLALERAAPPRKTSTTEGDRTDELDRAADARKKADRPAVVPFHLNLQAAS